MVALATKVLEAATGVKAGEDTLTQAFGQDRVIPGIGGGLVNAVVDNSKGVSGGLQTDDARLQALAAAAREQDNGMAV